MQVPKHLSVLLKKSEILQPFYHKQHNVSCDHFQLKWN